MSCSKPCSVLRVALGVASLLVAASAAAAPSETASAGGAGLFAPPALRPSVVVSHTITRSASDMKSILRTAEAIPERPFLVYPWVTGAFEGLGVMFSGHM